MIKLPRLKGDEGIYWKNDTSIQLADLGRTLPYFLKNNPSNKITVDNEKFPVTHLWTLLTEKNSAIPALRPLLIEAPNTWTKKLSEAQFAILQNHELYIDTQKPGIFSTLSDRMESTNIYEEKLQNFEKIKLDLDEIRRKTQIQPISITPRNMNINATDRLISLNMSFENIWGLSFRNEAH